MVCCAGTFSHSLWSPDEPTGAAVGRAMLDTGDLIVPRLNGSPFLEKPPLYWWVQVAAFKVFGLSHGVARLPSALFGVLTMVATYFLGRRLGGPRQGLLAAAVLGSTALFAEEVERVVVDPALAFFVTLAHCGFAVLAEPRSPAERRWARGLIALAAPLAFLSKGVVALGLGVAPPVLWLLATRRTRSMRTFRDLLPLAALGVPLFALLVIPWAVALYKAAGWPALQECLLNNTTGRFLNGQRGTVYGHRQPWWYYGTTAPAVLLPWSLALPAMLKAGLLRRRQDLPVRPGAEARALLFTTVVLGILFLSVAASKRELYLLPLLPAWSLCVAWWLEGDGEDGRHSWDRPTLLILTGLAIVLPLLLWGIALVVKLTPPRSAALTPLQEGLSPAVLALFGLVALAGSGTLLIHLLRRRSLTPAWIVTPFLLLFVAVESEIKALVDPIKSLSATTAAVARYLPGTDPVPAYLPPGSSNESVFGIIGFDLGRRTRPLTTPYELHAWLERTPGARVLVRAEQARRLPPALLRRLCFVYDETGRKASPYAIAEWSSMGL